MPLARRNQSLDVLRGIAILLVCGQHMEGPLPQGPLNRVADWWHTQGGTGVDLFFVLSGFLVSGLLVEEHARTGEVRVGRFLWRRGLKLYPAYFAFLAWLLLRPTLAAAMAHSDWFEVLRQRSWELLPNTLFVQNYWWNEFTTPLHTWSLAVEEHFYLTIPFVLSFVLRRNLLGLVPLMWIGGELLSIWMRTLPHPWFGPTHLHGSELLAGVALRCAWAAFPRVRAWTSKAAWPLVAVGIVGYGLVATMAPQHWARIPVLELASVALVAGAIHLDGARFPAQLRVFASVPRFAAWIGFHSYSIYLWHVTGMRVAERWFAPSAEGTPSSAQWLQTAVVACSGAIVLGWIAGRLVEYPVLRLRDRLWPSPTAGTPGK